MHNIWFQTAAELLEFKDFQYGGFYLEL